MAIASSASATCGQAVSASEYTAIERMPRARQARMIRRAISPRFATRTLCSTGSGERRGGGGDGLERGDAPARAGGHPAEQEGEARPVAVDAELHQALRPHPGEGHDPMAPAPRGEQARLDVRTGRERRVEPPTRPLHI